MFSAFLDFQKSLLFQIFLGVNSHGWKFFFGGGSFWILVLLNAFDPKNIY